MKTGSSAKAGRRKEALDSIDWAAEIAAARAERGITEEERRKRARAAEKAHRLRLKRKCFAAYGGVCACCGERREEFLTLDHIGGKKVSPKLVLRTYGYNAYAEYRELRDRGYPKGKHRLLCMNCNWVRKNGKLCPHELEKETRKRVAQ